MQCAPMYMVTYPQGGNYLVNPILRLLAAPDLPRPFFFFPRAESPFSSSDASAEADGVTSFRSRLCGRPLTGRGGGVGVPTADDSSEESSSGAEGGDRRVTRERRYLERAIGQVWAKLGRVASVTSGVGCDLTSPGCP